MKYRLEISRTAEKELKSLPEKLQNRVIQKIFALETHPRPTGCKKLRGSDYYRIRVGDYRIIYSVRDKILLVEVLDLGHRRDIYR